VNATSFCEGPSDRERRATGKRRLVPAHSGSFRTLSAAFRCLRPFTAIYGHSAFSGAFRLCATVASSNRARGVDEVAS
jgi:hypothetical protein